MIAVADTSPLNYLVLIDRIRILPRLFEHVIVPAGVIGELQHPRSPPPVAAWAAHPPEWVNRIACARGRCWHGGFERLCSIAPGDKFPCIARDSPSCSRSARWLNVGALLLNETARAGSLSRRDKATGAGAECQCAATRGGELVMGPWRKMSDKMPSWPLGNGGDTRCGRHTMLSMVRQR
jgi:hypothetical protein